MNVGIFSSVITAHQHRPAAGVTGDIDHRSAQQRDARCEQIDLATWAIAAEAIDQSGRQQRALARFHPHFATRPAVGEDTAADLERDVVARRDVDTAAILFNAADFDGALRYECAGVSLHAHRAAGRAGRLHNAAGFERDAGAALHRDDTAALPAARAQLRAVRERHRARRAHRDLTRAA